MADSVWFGYVGAVTGVIGAVTGIAGSVMGFVAYRHAKQIKSLDLRIELRKADTRIRVGLDALPRQVSQADRSRKAVMGATGLLLSGAAVQWEHAIQTDQEELKHLAAARPPENTYVGAPQGKLEAELVRAHELVLRIELLETKYRKTIEDDDRQRDHIRDDARARIQGSGARF